MSITVLFWVSVCSLSYSAWNAHAPYCHVACPAFQYFSTLSYKRHNFGEKRSHLNIKCVLIFSTTFLWKFLIPRRNERDIIKNVNWSSCEVPVILVGSKWNLNFLSRFFDKWSNIEFPENPHRATRVVPCERTDSSIDSHDEAGSRFSQFCECAWKSVPERGHLYVNYRKWQEDAESYAIRNLFIRFYKCYWSVQFKAEETGWVCKCEKCIKF